MEQRSRRLRRGAFAGVAVDEQVRAPHRLDIDAADQGSQHRVEAMVARPRRRDQEQRIIAWDRMGRVGQDDEVLRRNPSVARKRRNDIGFAAGQRAVHERRFE